MEKYVIAVRRGFRDKVGVDWASPLRAMRGLHVIGDANPYRLRIEATESAIQAARKELSSVCIIEPVQHRVVLTESGSR